VFDTCRKNFNDQSVVHRISAIDLGIGGDHLGPLLHGQMLTLEDLRMHARDEGILVVRST
jgi:hypothetical protein